MTAQKTIQLTMAEIKELNFQLEKSLQEIQQQIDALGSESEKVVVQEKQAFLERIMAKING